MIDRIEYAQTFECSDRPALWHHALQRIEQLRIKISTALRLIEVGDVPAIGIVVLVTEQVPADSQTTVRGKGSEKRQFDEVPDVAGITVLQSLIASLDLWKPRVNAGPSSQQEAWGRKRPPISHKIQYRGRYAFDPKPTSGWRANGYILTQGIIFGRVPDNRLDSCKRTHRRTNTWSVRTSRVGWRD